MYDKFNHAPGCPCDRCNKAHQCEVKTAGSTGRHTHYRVTSGSGNGKIYTVTMNQKGQATCNCDANWDSVNNRPRAYWASCSHQQAVRWHEDRFNQPVLQPAQDGIPASFYHPVLVPDEDGMVWA